MPEVLGASGYRTCIAGKLTTILTPPRSWLEGAPPMPMAVAQAVPEPVIVNAGEAGAIRAGNVA